MPLPPRVILELIKAELFSLQGHSPHYQSGVCPIVSVPAPFPNLYLYTLIYSLWSSYYVRKMGLRTAAGLGTLKATKWFHRLLTRSNV